VSAFVSVHVIYASALNTLHAELLDAHSLLFVDWKKSSSVEPGIS
jgi:hypothetical protein